MRRLQWDQATARNSNCRYRADSELIGLGVHRATIVTSSPPPLNEWCLRTWQPAASSYVRPTCEVLLVKSPVRLKIHRCWVRSAFDQTVALTGITDFQRLGEGEVRTDAERIGSAKGRAIYNGSTATH
jgi:hypothetical protein